MADERDVGGFDLRIDSRVITTHHHWLRFSLVGVMLLVTTIASGADEKIADFTLRDLRGQPHALADYTGRGLVVVAFLGTECPLARLYGPTLARLADDYAPRGVSVIGIASNLQDSIAELEHYAREYRFQFPILRDPGNVVADLFDAERTPEFFLLDQQNVVRYRGRIDDQYGVGYQRPAPTRRDLIVAIEELLDGQPVSRPHQPAVGCLIGRVPIASHEGSITWSGQMGRLVHQHCTPCHRPGDIAPFPLVTYEDAIGWSHMMREVVIQGRMPPWYADDHYGTFSNDPRLDPSEILLFEQWAQNGAPEGEIGKPVYDAEIAPSESSWQIEPDVVIPMRDDPFMVPAEGTLDYQYFRVDPGFTEDKWIQAVQCRPGNRNVVHHFAAFIVDPGAKPNTADGELLTGYAPGMRALTFEPGYAKLIPAGSHIQYVMHYTPIGTPQEDLSKIGLSFADPGSVKYPVVVLTNTSRDIEIPPHDDSYVVENTITIPRACELLSLVPHMHLRGKTFQFQAIYADNSREILLRVPNYDFNWQLQYRLREPKALPAGTRIQCQAMYDNSADNLRNPDPGVTVTWGEKTTDEMMDGFIEVAWREAALAPAADSGVRIWAVVTVGSVLGGVLLALQRWRRRRLG